MDDLAWRDAQARKQQQLVAAINVETLKHGNNGQNQLIALINAESIASFESFDVFEASLESICRGYTQRGIPRIINEKLYPWFDHLQSFTAAISASTQANSYASLCWGALLIVIQVSAPTKTEANARFRIETPHHCSDSFLETS